MSDTIQERLSWAAAEAAAEINRLRAELAEAKERMRLKDEAIARLTNSVLDKGRWIAELERELADVKASSEVGELLKVALNMPGTGSYIEWAKECRAAYDELDRLCDDNVKLTEAYDDLNIQFERAAGHAAECENGEKEALSKLAEARGRIEELEAAHKHFCLDQCVLITEEQINAAWAGSNAGCFEEEDFCAGVRWGLAEFGIVPCEKCNGTKYVLTKCIGRVEDHDEYDGAHNCDCPNNGWVMEMEER